MKYASTLAVLGLAFASLASPAHADQALSRQPAASANDALSGVVDDEGRFRHRRAMLSHLRGKAAKNGRTERVQAIDRLLERQKKRHHARLEGHRGRLGPEAWERFESRRAAVRERRETPSEHL